MLKRLLVGLVALTALCTGVVVLAGPASAHANVVTGTSVCQDNGKYAVTWTIANDYALPETASSRLGNVQIGKNGSKTQNETVAGSTTHLSLAVKGVWSDGYSQSDTGNLSLSGTCKPALKHTTVSVTFTDKDQCIGGGSYTDTFDKNAVHEAVTGDTNPGDTITVSFTAKSGYVIDGQASFSHTFPAKADCRTVVTPVSPTVTQSVCTGPGTHSDASIVPATTEGITYTVSGNVVTATANNGNKLGNLPNGWTSVSDTVATYTVDLTNPGSCLVKAVAVAPDVTQASCTGPGTSGGFSITLAANTDAITYSLSGDVVTATLASGYRFPVAYGQPGGYQGWTLQDNGTATYTVTEVSPGNCLVETTPVNPTVSDYVCTAPGQHSGGDIVLADNTDAITYSLAGNVVTATLAQGYKFGDLPNGWVSHENSASFLVDVPAAPDCIVQTVPVSINVPNPDCTSQNVTVTIPTTEGVEYQINGQDASGTSVTVKPQGSSVTVTPVAKSGYVLAGDFKASTVISNDLDTTKCTTTPPSSPPVTPTPPSTPTPPHHSVTPPNHHSTPAPPVKPHHPLASTGVPTAEIGGIAVLLLASGLLFLLAGRRKSGHQH